MALTERVIDNDVADVRPRRWMFVHPYGAAGDTIAMPADKAEQRIASGEAFEVVPPSGDPVVNGSLIAMIRASLLMDPEHSGLMAAISTHGRQTSNPELAYYSNRWPNRLMAAEYKVEDFLEPPCGWYFVTFSQAGLKDPSATHLTNNLIRRRGEILAGIFESLRIGSVIATGHSISNLAQSVTIPPILWGSAGTAVDTKTGHVWVGGVLAFVTVEIQPAPGSNHLSENDAKQILVGLSFEMVKMDRKFTSDEAMRLLQSRFAGSPNASRSQICRFLRDINPNGWAGTGRRRSNATPSSDELTAAFRSALESLT